MNNSLIKIEKKNNSSFLFFVLSTVNVLVSLLVGFLIPMKLSINTYGYYKIFTMYFVYIIYLNLGITNSTLLLFADKNFDDIKKTLRKLFSLLFWLGLFLMFVIMIFSLIFENSSDRLYIYILLCINIPIVFLRDYLKRVLFIKENATYISFGNLISRLVFLVMVVILYFMNVRDFYLYVLMYTVSNITALVLFLFRCSSVISFKFDFFSLDFRKTLIKILNVGFIAFISGLFILLTFGMDRIFIDIFYSEMEVGIYSLAYSFVVIIVSIITPLSELFYKKLINIKEYDAIYKIMTFAISILGVVVYCGFFLTQIVVYWLLPKYIVSLDIMANIYLIVFPKIMFSLVFYNLFMLTSKFKKYLYLTCAVFVLSIICYLSVYFFTKDYYYFSIASIGIVYFLYIICKILVTLQFKTIVLFDFVFIGGSTIIYYLVYRTIVNIYIQLIVYSVYSLLIIIILIIYFTKRHYSLIQLKQFLNECEKIS